MTDLLLVGGAIVAPILALLVIKTRFGFPHHRKLALVAYGLGWLPLAWLMNSDGVAVPLDEESFLASLNTQWTPYLAGTLTLFLVGVAWKLLPSPGPDLAAQPEEALNEVIAEDMQLLRYLLFRVDLASRHLIRGGLLGKVPETLTEAERDSLLPRVDRLHAAVLDSELLGRAYDTFPKLPKSGNALGHSRAFLLRFATFVGNYRASSLVAAEAGDFGLIPELRPQAKQARCSHAALQLDLGVRHLEELREGLRGESDILERIDAWVEDLLAHRQVKPSAWKLRPLDYFEGRSFGSSVTVPGSVLQHQIEHRVSPPPATLRSEQVRAYVAHLEPGDILVTRRASRRTSLSVPGYWTHLALYVGTPNQLDAFFEDLPATSKRSASELIFAACPLADGALGAPDAEGYPTSVLEAGHRGVILTAFEVCGAADCLAVLRPRISKAKRLQGLLASFEHLGKPFDYNFDFASDAALSSSELIYRSYPKLAPLQARDVGGRELITANEVVERWAVQKSDRDVGDLEFVLFLDGQGKPGKYTSEDATALTQSHQRPKWGQRHPSS